MQTENLISAVNELKFQIPRFQFSPSFFTFKWESVAYNTWNKFSYEGPIYERESQTMNSIIFCSKHFPSDGLVKWNMAAHRGHADPSW